MSVIINESDHQRVNAAVQSAESQTSAEIVPVIAASSGRYDRAEDIVGLWFAIVALAVVWWALPSPGTDSGSWAGFAPIWELSIHIGAVVVAFVIGALIASRVDSLRRLFAPRQQMRDEVERQARAIFFDKRVHHTQSGAGLLLYVSLFEHRAAVIADQSITEKLGQSELDKICQQFTAELHDSKPIDALCATISEVGRRLQAVLPRAQNDVNELSDALVVIDQN